MTVAGRPPGWVALLALAGATLWAAPAAAQGERGLPKSKLAHRHAALASRDGWVTMTVSYRDVVNTSVRRKLLSGLPTVIAARAYVFPVASQRPVGLSIRTCRVVFDLWDEVFRIELRGGGHRRHTVAVNVEGVLRRCAEARREPVVVLRALSPARRYFIGVLVEVNPLSRAMMNRIKRWVSKPKGYGALGPGDSLFGSFVGLFVTQVPAADRSVAFRSQAFLPRALPKLPSPSKRRRAER